MCFRRCGELHSVSKAQQLRGRGRRRERAPSAVQHRPHRWRRRGLRLSPAGHRRDLRGVLPAAARQALGHPPPSALAVLAHQPQAGRRRGHQQLQQQRLRAQRHHHPPPDVRLSLLPALREGERGLRPPRLHRPGDAASEPSQHLLQSMRRPPLRPPGHTHLPPPITNNPPAPNEATAKLAITALTMKPTIQPVLSLGPHSLPHEPTPPQATVVFLAE